MKLTGRPYVVVTSWQKEKKYMRQLLIKFEKKLILVLFWATLTRKSHSYIFSRNPTISLFKLDNTQTLYKKSKNFSQRFRKTQNKRTNKLISEQRDRQTNGIYVGSSLRGSNVKNTHGGMLFLIKSNTSP